MSCYGAGMPEASPTRNSSPSSDRQFYLFNAALSLSALAFLGYLLLVRQGDASGSVDLRFLPAVNATLNALAATCLAAGYVAIRRGAQRVHQYFMVSAFAASSLFLACYVAYHFAHGHTRYQGTGAARVIYLWVLLSHIALSTTVVPLALTSFYLSWRKSFARHKRVSRITLPIWLYVSITGVLIFFLLRGSPTAA